MSGGDGEALDAALGLLRAPARRTLLRERALPGGMGELVAAAAGSEPALRGAAGRTGAPREELQEAARFFAQQVMFAEEADAYRVLGSRRGAPDAELRDHHRLLLHWLHPDRQGGVDSWESAFSHRVNWAWNQVRTPALRERYDASLPEETARPHVPVQLPRGARARRDAYGGPQSGGWVVAVVGVVCVALGWMAVRREQQLDALRDDGGIAMAAQTLVPVDAGEAIEGDANTNSNADAPLGVRGMLFDEAIPKADAAPAEGAPPSADARANDALVLDQKTDVPDDAAETVSRATARLQDDGEAHEPRARTGSQVSRPADAPAPTPAIGPLQLLNEADATVHRLVGWLTGTGQPPAWRDPDARRAGERARVALATRPPGTQLALQNPGWVLDAALASLDAAYHLEAGGRVHGTGMVHVRLQRAASGWQVSDVRAEPAR
jgi:hypothetical protein